MRYLSVCSGIEAATVAWHHMGWEPVAFSEIEKFPSAVLAHHYPSVPNWGDMTKYKEWPDANVDVLVGGTPCQSFSVAGLRKGLDDPRGNLMLIYLAIAQRYRPEWLVWENVPGVLSSNGGRDFAALLRGLAELGYGWAYRVLDAQYFGVAQRRRRVFVVGHLGDWHRAAAVLFERHSLSGHPAPSRQARKGTASGAASGTRAGGWPAEVSPTLNACFGSKQGLEDQHIAGGGDCLSPPVAMCLITKTRLDSETETLIPTIGGGFDAVAFPWQSALDPVGNPTDISGTLVKNQTMAVAIQDVREVEKAQNGKGWNDDGSAYTVDTHATQGVAVAFGGDIARSLTARHDSSPCADRGMNVVAVPFGVGESPDVGHCLRSGASKADKHESTTYVQTAMQVRRLTPVECERLQGFPDGYTRIPNWSGWRAMDADETPDECTEQGLRVKQNKKTGRWSVNDVDGPRYKALGNSMAVPVMRHIGERINEVSKL